MSGRWARYERALFGIGVDLRQGAGQGVGIAGPVGSGVVGSVFAGARDGELDQHGCEWGEEDHGNGCDATASAAIVAAAAHAAKNHAPASNRRMPWVTATEAWFGFRPVAKALGESDGMR